MGKVRLVQGQAVEIWTAQRLEIVTLGLRPGDMRRQQGRLRHRGSTGGYDRQGGTSITRLPPSAIRNTRSYLS